MTRRKIVFSTGGAAYETPEFNGDRAEYKQSKTPNLCSKDWSEIEAEFAAVESLDQFIEASARAQGYYRSSISGQCTFLPVLPTSGNFPEGVQLREIKENMIVEER
jgi:hypothetical protein